MATTDANLKYRVLEIMTLRVQATPVYALNVDATMDLMIGTIRCSRLAARTGLCDRQRPTIHVEQKAIATARSISISAEYTLRIWR